MVSREESGTKGDEVLAGFFGSFRAFCSAILEKATLVGGHRPSLQAGPYLTGSRKNTIVPTSMTKPNRVSPSPRRV